ncbi:sensor histidine kinase [Novosphingobium olei]|uniref:sensor histidine kinase n=1 Tax=Novosphingobium olei TaxID=2728851 RepID=UPI00308B4F63|nr:ATP-binding protein [Novosphingobium olei]
MGDWQTCRSCPGYPADCPPKASIPFQNSRTHRTRVHRLRRMDGETNVLEYLQTFLAVRGLAPHGYCLLWDPALIWTHVAADAVIAACYFSIPILLFRLLAMRRDIKFGWMLAAFGLSILACGMTHVLSIVTLWIPAYGWEALVKVVTAMASLVTAVLLLRLLPNLVAIPSPAQLERVNEALRQEVLERARAEEMLRQSQKMQAIGQLAGGIAHDFNNLLGVIIGNIDRAQRKGTGTPEGEKAIGNALQGAERAARLTHQLLAFTRQQPLQRQPHDINAIARASADLLDETVGPRIEVALDLADDLPPCLVDASQLEMALLNLGLNARDAIDVSGTITIGTRLAAPALVEIRVADTGCGMDSATLERAMEPFFTTKEVGKGTGLGLSQVFGSVEQMGGRLEIETSPGTGTTVRLFMPTDGGTDGIYNLSG